MAHSRRSLRQVSPFPDLQDGCGAQLHPRPCLQSWAGSRLRSRQRVVRRTKKKAWLKEIRRLANVHGNPAGWSSRSGAVGERLRAQRVQINYVIDLASAVRKHMFL